MPQDIDDCISTMEGKVDNVYAFCNWAKEQGKGPFAHAEAVDLGGAVKEFEEASGRKDVIPAVEIFEAGNWKGETYGEADLDQIVENYRRNRHLFEPPLKVGHEEDQPELLQNSGTPAVGWVVGLRRVGSKLFADLSQIDPDIGDLIQAGAYRHVSAELYPPDQPPEGVPVHGWGLKAVSILGGKLPHIKSLKWLADRVRKHSETLRPRHAPRVRLTASRRLWQDSSRTWLCFSEVRAMADDATTQVANAAIMQQFPGLPEEFVQSLTPDQMGMLATAIAPAAAGEGEATSMQDTPERGQMIADLVALGEDPAALEAMTDADLQTLWQQKKGTTMAETSVATTTATPPPATPVPTKPEPRQPQQIITTQKFSEERLTLLEKRLEAAEREQRRRDRLDRLAEAQKKKAAVRAFCEQLNRSGKASAAEVEFDPKTGEPLGALAFALTAASSVRKFSEDGKETKSDLEVLMEKLEARKARQFSEQVQDPVNQNGSRLSAERREQILSLTGRGRNVLKKEEAGKQNARVFAEALAGVLQGKLNGQG